MKRLIASILVFLVAFDIGMWAVFLSRLDFVSDKEISALTSTVNAPMPARENIPPALIDSPEPDASEYPDYEPTPDGVYFPINGNRFEKDFALVMTIFEGETVGLMKIGDEFFESDLSWVGPQKVVMRTKAKNGIHYEFRGKFIRNGFKEWFERGETVLSGTLTKYTGKREVYSHSSRYLYTPEVCAWREENQ